MAVALKRKSWKHSSASSTEESLSPEDIKLRHNASLIDSEPGSVSDEVLTILNMAEAVMPKLEQYWKNLKTWNIMLKPQTRKSAIVKQKSSVLSLSRVTQKKRLKNLRTG